MYMLFIILQADTFQEGWMEFDWQLWAPIIVASVATLISIISIILVIRLRNFLKDKTDYENIYNAKTIRDLVVAIMKDSPRIRSLIEECVVSKNEQYYKKQNRETSISSFNDVDNIIQNKVEKESEFSMNNPSTSWNCTKTMQSHINSIILYASSYDSDNNKFYVVSKQPSERTIFTIIVSSSDNQTGTFDLYEGALEKVQKCKDFLEVCCEVEGFGSKAHTIKKGTVSLMGGDWTVVNKLKVEFI